MSDPEINAALFVLSDPERTLVRIKRLQRTKKLIFASIALVLVALFFRLAFVVFLTTLYIQPELIGVLGLMILGLCIALVPVHCELRMLAHVEALRQVGAAGREGAENGPATPPEES